MKKLLAISIVTALSGIGMAHAQPADAEHAARSSKARTEQHDASAHGRGHDRKAKFDKLDTNGDGAVSRNEMLEKASARFEKKQAKRAAEGREEVKPTTEDRTARLNRRFDKLDTDQSGTLTREERLLAPNLP